MNDLERRVAKLDMPSKDDISDFANAASTGKFSLPDIDMPSADDIAAFAKAASTGKMFDP